jgi:hypothetical protein
MLNLLLSLAGAYALICIGARVLHRRFVYVPNCARCEPEKAGLIGVQEISLRPPMASRSSLGIYRLRMVSQRFSISSEIMAAPLGDHDEILITLY